MNKNELKKIIDSLGITAAEGANKETQAGAYPRVVYYDYTWEDIVASDTEYDTVETYQVSFYSKEPRHSKLLELRQKLRECKLYPVIYTDYVQEERVFHSYFSLETVVDE